MIITDIVVAVADLLMRILFHRGVDLHIITMIMGGSLVLILLLLLLKVCVWLRWTVYEYVLLVACRLRRIC